MTRTRITLASLKSLPLTARYDAMRKIIEKGKGIDDECLNSAFRKLCVRRTWPKGRDCALVSYGRADRWNFNPDPTKRFGADDYMLPPSRSASSPDALYRLLHIIQPSRFVAKVDYYKGGIFRFFSPDRRFLCWVGFHKCELELNFYCKRADLFIPDDPQWPEALRTGPQTEEEAMNWYTPETGGWSKFLAVPENRALFDAYRAAQDAYQNQGIIVPWSTGKMRCKSPSGQAWMRLVVTAMNTPWMIYGGNNFEV